MELRHRLYILLGAETERPGTELADVSMANPQDSQGTWGITVATDDGRRYLITLTEL